MNNDLLITKLKSGKANNQEIKLAQSIIQKNIIHSFKNYCQYMLPDFDWQSFHFYMMDNLDNSLINPSKIMFSLPFRAGKSLICQLFASYIFGRYPNKAIGYFSYNQDIAEDMTKNIISFISSEKYQALFPFSRIKSMIEYSDMDSKTRKQNYQHAYGFTNVCSNRGKFLAGGRGSRLTGIGLDILILDDYTKDWTEVSSLKNRDSMWEWFNKVFLTRRENNPTVIVTATNWHNDDIIGRIRKLDLKLREDPKYKRWLDIIFEAFKDRQDNNDYDSREINQVLWQRQEENWYEMKLTDPIGFMAMCQQKPINELGFLINREQISRYNYLPISIEQGKIIISIDTNLTNKSKYGDDAGISIWLNYSHNLYLLEFISERFSYVELKSFIKKIIRNKYPHYSTILIEKKASGEALISDLEQEFGRIIGFDPGTKSKLERFGLALPSLQAGNVIFPNDRLYPKIEFMINQIVSFTGEKDGKDDLVDTMTQAILYTMNNVIKASKIVSSNIGQLITAHPKELANRFSHMQHKMHNKIQKLTNRKRFNPF